MKTVLAVQLSLPILAIATDNAKQQKATKSITLPPESNRVEFSDLSFMTDVDDPDGIGHLQFIDVKNKLILDISKSQVGFRLISQKHHKPDLSVAYLHQNGDGIPESAIKTDRGKITSYRVGLKLIELPKDN